jgi:hypothetical protein
VTIIDVPRPSKNAMNPDRPVSSLLLAQIQHLQHAERRLPLRYRTEIYTHAIRTEGEAARYIHEVTEAIHQAHADAAAHRAKRARVGKPGLEIAAAAERPARKGRSRANAKSRKHGKRK